MTRHLHIYDIGYKQCYYLQRDNEDLRDFDSATSGAIVQRFLCLLPEVSIAG